VLVCGACLGRLCQSVGHVWWLSASLGLSAGLARRDHLQGASWRRKKRVEKRLQLRQVNTILLLAIVVALATGCSEGPQGQRHCPCPSTGVLYYLSPLSDSELGRPDKATRARQCRRREPSQGQSLGLPAAWAHPYWKSGGGRLKRPVGAPIGAYLSTCIQLSARWAPRCKVGAIVRRAVGPKKGEHHERDSNPALRHARDAACEAPACQSGGALIGSLQSHDNNNNNHQRCPPLCQHLCPTNSLHSSRN